MSRPHRLHWRDVLRYAIGANRATIRRLYAQYRLDSGIPDRCDIPTCVFFTQPLVWNGQPVPLILDHANGVRADNSPGNLRYLCPNCEAQQKLTRAGANKGRVSMSRGGYGIRRSDGSGLRDYVLPAEPAEYKVTGSSAELSRGARPDTEA